jgi:DnaJ-class molecular chaperone
MADYYAVLGVSAAAPLAAIRQAYLAAVLAQHPDKRQQQAAGAAAGDEDDGHQQATAAFLQLQEAWETLRDDARRLDYDARLCDYGAGGRGSAGGASSQASRVHVSDCLPVGEMDYDEAGDAFTSPCRCGGEYRVRADEALRAPRTVVSCTGCSLRAVVVGEAAPADGGSDSDAGAGGGQDEAAASGAGTVGGLG